MWCLRMWGLKLILYRPSTTEGVGTSHLKLIWVRGLTTIIFKPHILKHHIPEHPNLEQRVPSLVPASSSRNVLNYAALKLSRAIRGSSISVSITLPPLLLQDRGGFGRVAATTTTTTTTNTSTTTTTNNYHNNSNK